MANPGRQSQFRWNLSLVFSFLLVFYPGFGLADDIKPSGFSPQPGDRFYLLSEATFSPNEEAMVRLEAPDGAASGSAQGVDIRLYRVPDPINFLKKQKNLHRPTLEAEHSKDGLANALSYLWDSWYKKSRLVWQRIVSETVRKKAVEYAPQLKQAPPYTYRTAFQNPAQFKPIPGLDLIDQFRYPVMQAKPITPPAGVDMMGSTLVVRKGNVKIPLGKLQPGLYLVEGMLGSFRASCFLFISNTVALTKLSSQQEMIWTVKKDNGDVVPGVQLVLTDGVGVLGEGRSNEQGIFQFSGKNLERSYVLGRDPDGGIVVSENYYFDSEIYSNKLYIFTDRPLYQPGDTVQVKVMGREFVNSQKSTALANAPLQLAVFDAAGTRIAEQDLTLPSLADGANTSFVIPDEAVAGGYTLQIQYKKITYASAFRVARYVKPHFQIDVNFDKPAYKTGETIKGLVQLTYGNGEAVKNAFVDLEVRKQRLTIVEGEVEAKDRFPLQLLQSKLTSDGSGKAAFEIPAASESTRFTLHVKVADQSSYRVSATRDLLVQMVERPLALRASTHFSQPKEKFKLSWSADATQKPKSWEAIRLQDQSRLSGDLDKGATETTLVFDQAGSYSIHILDAQGLILGSVSHSVLGPELTTVPGTISIIFDKDEYDVGSTARASITFSEPVKTSLVTMELDQVERYTLIQNSQKWIRLIRVSDQQYLAEIPVEESYSPNITLSFAYVSKGQYVFENKGLKVRKPGVKIAITPDKTEYKPGETVNLDIQTSYLNQPVSTALTLAVVDEMIYGLQPEITPHIMDFFFHPRRNQVRTASSLTFHSYDAAVSALGIMPSSGSGGYSERSLKVRVRPRRDDKDTAAWAPNLRTDDQGKLKFSFTMPDSLTRWRVTARALTAEGHVGQGTTSLLSKKDVYMKWTAVNQYREGDQSQVQLALFNMLASKKDVVLDVKGGGGNTQKSLTLEPGPNYVDFPQTFKEATKLLLTVKQKDAILDQLEVPVTVVPVGWSSTQNSTLNSDFKLPPSARHVRLGTTGAGTDAFIALADELIDYPYGCVEQTSSRLISLALIQLNLKKWSMPADMERQLHRRLNSERLRLIQMAGPEARFTWWGRSSQDSLLITGYAYFADWWATKAMGTELPKKHWETLLDFYASRADQTALDERILFVWMANEMNLPVKNLVSGLVEQADAARQLTDESWILIGGSEPDHLLFILLDVMSRRHGVTIPEKLNARIQQAKESAQQTMGLERVAHLYAGGNDRNLANALLHAISNSEWSTFKRSLAMVMLYKILGGSLDQPAAGMTPGNGWIQGSSVIGRPFWSFDPKAGSPQWNALPQLPEGSAWRVSYDSFDEAKSNLPVKIERKLYRLVQKDKPLSYEMQLVEKPWVLDPRDLYLDELELKGGEKPVKFGLVTAGLPPGATVEEITWGLTVTNAEGGTIDLDSSGLQSGAGYYARAVEELSDSRRIYQLVRFSQAGKFKIPQARYFKMYDPGQQAFEGGTSTASQTLEVR